MNILKEELARKRKLLEEQNVLSDNKKYFKRSDLLCPNEKKKHPESDQSDPVDSSHDKCEDSVLNEDSYNALSRPEVIRRLRDFGEPMLLFAETELDSFKRLRKCEISKPEANRGYRNDFQTAMNEVDEDYLNEILASSKPQQSEKGDANDKKATQDLYYPTLDITYEEIQESTAKLNNRDKDYNMSVIERFIQFLVQQWGNQLNCRGTVEKMSSRGKIDSATYAQTKEYMKPLLRKLRRKSLPEDITDSLTQIVKHVLERNYILASDAYLEMAIGNSPWPIGVTMVGIHARTGREKIFSKNVAHVMNDETQRKYIQGLKRLMTKCQEYYPTDPSRCVEYSKR